MKTMLAGASSRAVPMAGEETLVRLIKHTDPSKYRLYHSHQNTGYMACQYSSLIIRRISLWNS